MRREITLYSLAVSYLARREHAKKELVQKLLNKGHTLQDIEVVVHRLVKQGLLSDLRYASMIIRAKSNKNYGNRYIYQFLLQQGVDEQVIDEAFNYQEIETPEQQARIHNILRKKKPNLDVYPEKQKFITSLVRKGFDLESIQEALESFEGSSN